MPSVQTVLDALESIAPARTAFSFDKVGLQVGEPSDPVLVGVVALDPSAGLLEFAAEKRAQLAVCHHPLIWEPLAAVNGSTRSGRLASAFLRQGVAFIGAHTNWDCAPGGINDTLASLLGLRNVQFCGEAAEVAYSKLATFVPPANVEAVVDALSAAGAGVIGLYERCAFLSEGQGTFRGRKGAKPSVGSAKQVEIVDEVRVEMRLRDALVGEAVEALRAVHPYEEPAYDLFALKPSPEQPISRVGELEAPISFSEFAGLVDRQLSTRCWAFGDPNRTVRRVTVCGGAADGEWTTALRNGSDAFVTGEVRHHIAIEASEAGIGIIAAGHYATEQPGAIAIANALKKLTPGVEWHAYAPQPGFTGNAAQ